MEDDWKRPHCFIETTDSGLQINEETLKKLHKIKDPVSVVAVVGPYRTGKSYLMNILAGTQTGFSLGSTIQATTKGIWVWCRPHPTKKGQYLLLLDTEGLEDVEKGDKNQDTWIFILAILLSSTLIYNTMNTIDGDALNALHFMSEMSNHVRIKASTVKDEGTKFDAVFPNFIWAIRDFNLELKLNEKSISSDEYLEHALRVKPGSGKKTTDYNHTRKCIKNYFPLRKCFVFPQPVADRSKVKHLDSLTKSQLARDFLSVSDQFTECVIKHLECKTIYGTHVTGRVLGNLAKCYVEAIQRGAVPCIQSALETSAQLENEKASRESLILYSTMMEERIKMPTEYDYQVKSANFDCAQAAMANFTDAVIFDTERIYQRQMTDKLKESYKCICEQNRQASIKVCSQILETLYGPISAQFQAGDFTKPGGYELYRDEMNTLERKYMETLGKGTMDSDVLNKFKQAKEFEKQSILAADWKLRKEQEKAEDMQRKAEEYKRRQRRAEIEKRKMEQKLADQQKAHEEALKEVRDKEERETSILLRQRQAQLNARLREREELHRQAFQQQVNGLLSQINQLGEEQRRQRKDDDEECIVM